MEVAVLGTPSLTVFMVSVDEKQRKRKKYMNTELTSCVKVEMAVLGSRP